MDDTRVAGIYLAAGNSSRMGTNKLNLPMGSDFLGSCAFRASLDSLLNMTIAVTRPDEALYWLTPFLGKPGWISVECNEASEGQSGSIKAGVKLAQKLGADGVMVLLGDQPFITKNMINELIDKFHRFPQLSYFAFSHQGFIRPPVLFAKHQFARLLELEGDEGARALIRGELKSEGMTMEIKDEFYFFDIDSYDEYLEAIKLAASILDKKTFIP